MKLDPPSISGAADLGGGAGDGIAGACLGAVLSRRAESEARSSLDLGSCSPWWWGRRWNSRGLPWRGLKEEGGE